MDPHVATPPDRKATETDNRPGDRKAQLLGVAAALVMQGGADAVTMESVAEAAQVSRPLVYKHFPNRGALLAALYAREATLVHGHLTRQVSAATSLEGMFQALVHGALETASGHSGVLTRLRDAGARTPEMRSDQRSRDTRTARAFARQAEREFDIDATHALMTMAMLLTLVDYVLNRWHARPDPANATFLEEIYMSIVRGTLASLSRR